MESTTQPILCCLGETVAGLPTQFLMERAFAAHKLDWRAITVEVAAQRFGVAVDGMQAMRFMAIRVFPTLEKVAAERFYEAGSLGAFVGSATSASLTDDGWDVWNNCGNSILKLLDEREPLERTIVWLHGNSVRTRSTLAAIAARAVAPSMVVWTEAAGFELESAPAELQNLAERLPNGLLVLESAEAFTGPLDAPLPAAEEASSPTMVLISDTLDAPTTQHAFAIFGSLEFESKGIVSNLSTSAPTGIFKIDNADVTIAAEAYDFERWTGVKVDQSVLRDAYDEYCDF